MFWHSAQSLCVVWLAPWLRRATGRTLTCPTLLCTPSENTGTKIRKMLSVARRALRNDQDSPSGLQMCMASVSPGLDMLPGRWVVCSFSTLVSAVRRQPAYSLTALRRALRENTVTKARKLISVPRGDIARPPGLSDWSTTVYGECFFRFRHDDASWVATNLEKVRSTTCTVCSTECDQTVHGAQTLPRAVRARFNTVGGQ